MTNVPPQEVYNATQDAIETENMIRNDAAKFEEEKLIVEEEQRREREIDDITYAQIYKLQENTRRLTTQFAKDYLEKNPQKECADCDTTSTLTGSCELIDNFYSCSAVGLAVEALNCEIEELQIFKMKKIRKGSWGGGEQFIPATPNDEVIPLPEKQNLLDQ